MNDPLNRAHEIAGRVAVAHQALMSLPSPEDIVAIVRAAGANAPAGQLRSTTLRVTILDRAASHFEEQAAQPGAHPANKIMANELRAMMHECFEDVKHEFPDYLEQEWRSAASVTKHLERIIATR